MINLPTTYILGGLALAAVTYFAVDEIRDARALNAMTEERNAFERLYHQAKNNVATLEGALARCNQSVQDSAELADAVAAAGVAAVRQVRRAGELSVERTVDRLMVAPTATCSDAEDILRGNAE